jgi:rod shape-determining protein MreC
MSKTGRRSRRGVVLLGVFLFMAGGLLVAQTAPQVRERFNWVRTSMGDRIKGEERIGLLAQITGQARRERRIRELELQVAELSRYKAAAVSMAERLETYEDILNLIGEPPMRGVTARVTAETNGPFENTLLANAGLLQGVESGSVAVNEGGLVGRVILLGERSARVLSISDFNSRVPVFGEASGLRAIMRGGSNQLGTLIDMPEVTDFIEGERILTSGEGGAFPRGLIVGEARKISKEWRVRYAMNAGSGGYVQIIPPQKIDVPVPLDPAKLAELQQTATPVPAPQPAQPRQSVTEPRPQPAPRPAAVRRPAPAPRPQEAVPPAVFVTPPPPVTVAPPADPAPAQPAPPATDSDPVRLTPDPSAGPPG